VQPLEQKYAIPVGVIFFVLSVASLLCGGLNYFHTLRRYGAHRALVQSGWKTQTVMILVATCIVASAILLTTTNAIGGTQS